MTSLDQIHALDRKIQHVMETLNGLRRTNDELTAALRDAEGRVTATEQARIAAEQKSRRLEEELGRLHTDREEIEATINRTLMHLDQLEQSPDAAAGAGDAAAHEAAAAAAGAGADADGETQRAPAGEPSAQDDDPAESNETATSEGSELDIF